MSAIEKVSVEFTAEDDSALPPYLKQERKKALEALRQAAHLTAVKDDYTIHIIRFSLEDQRLIMRFFDQDQNECAAHIMAIKPYRRLVQDYFLMLESYEQARMHATADRLEAIDMGRRGIHNEGAELVMKRMDGKLEMDFETARRLFTLICSLYKTTRGIGI